MIQVCAMPISLSAAAVFGAVVAVSIAPPARAAERVTVTVSNPSAFSRTDELIRIENAPLHRDAVSQPWVIDGRCRRPAQWTAGPAEGSPRSLVFTLDLAPRETKRVQLADDVVGVSPCGDSHPARATLVARNAKGTREVVAHTLVPESHQPGSGIYGFEGIGWESDKVGYRLYLDFRNAIDIFGKRKPEPVLTQLALSGTAYHAMANWGMDILKVGDSLGIGGIGGVVQGRIVRFERYRRHEARVVDEGPVLAAAEVSFAGWQAGSAITDIRSRYEIAAGSALTRAVVKVTEPQVRLATGIPRNAVAQRLTPMKARKWRYVASCGAQSLVPDDLGMAVLFRAEDRVDDIEDGHSDAVALKPSPDGALTYYFLASWEQGSGWAGSCRAFHEYLENASARLSAPVVVSVSGHASEHESVRE